LKDRLYAEAPDGPDRRAAQFVLARLHDALTRLLGPILPHTTEELWERLPDRPGKPSSVHLAEFPEPDPRFDDAERDARWATLLTVRDEILRVLEKLRAAKTIGSAQEAAVRLGTDDPALSGLIERYRATLTTLAIVSDLAIGDPPDDAAPGVELPRLKVHASRSSLTKCERCWNLRSTVGSVAKHPTLCERCARVLGTA
ncbi:MAG: class I tRNA ligase family protein, partial [Isosphaeraceae bacterium]